MKKIIYHGSEKILQRPFFSGGKKYNDYGPGLYCTESADMAKEWASNPDRDGYANQYTIEEEGLRILELSSPEYSVLHWLTILLENRTFDTYSLLAREAREYLNVRFRLPYEQYDVIIGYRADDSYFSFAQDFLNGTISLRQLENAMHLGKLGQQYVIKSEKAFDSLEFVSYEIVISEEWYLKRQARDRKARKDYFNYEKSRHQKGDLFITDLMDEDINDGDARLQRTLY